MIWPSAAHIADIAAPWSVAYCKPRQEKKLADDLRQRDIAYFLPMVLRETSSGGRRRKNLYPLFPSYVFFAGEERERLAVLRTDRIVQIIDVGSAEQICFRQEIAALETALEHFPESIELYPRIVPGARVRITAGPMRDVEGIVLQSQNKRKLWLGVSVLGVGATVEIHADMVVVE
ncbi:MAG: transcription termination/antitermination NusG family protein [Pirellulales bacterium]